MTAWGAMPFEAKTGAPMDEIRKKLEWFKTCILPYQGAVRARLRILTHDGGDLDDLVAEVLARAYANEHWRSVIHGHAYLLGIARNLVIDQARKNKIVSFEVITEIERLQSGYDLDAQLCARDQLRRLHSILSDLPPQSRRVFVARRIYGKNFREIAEEMSLSVSTVEKHFSRAIRLFMHALAAEEDAAFASVSHQSTKRDRTAGS